MKYLLSIIGFALFLCLLCSSINAQKITKLWDKTYGGNRGDGLSKILPAKNGGFFLCGVSASEAGGEKSQNSTNNFDFWVLLVDSFGNKLWDKKYGTLGRDAMNYLGNADTAVYS